MRTEVAPHPSFRLCGPALRCCRHAAGTATCPEWRQESEGGKTAMTDTRPFDPDLFRDAAIEPETAALNAKMIELMEGQPEWWIIGAENARAARRRGEGRGPAPGRPGWARPH